MAGDPWLESARRGGRGSSAAQPTQAPASDPWLASAMAYGDSTKSALASAGAEIQGALPFADLSTVQDAGRQLQAFNPEDQWVLASRLKVAGQKLSGVHKAAGQVAGRQQAEGMTTEAGALQQAQQLARQGGQGAAQLGINGGKALFHALDTPGRVVRGGQSAEDWNKDLRDSQNPLARGFVGATNAVGALAGVPLGAAIGAFGAATDLAAGNKPTWDNFAHTVKETSQDVGDLVRTTVADPLSYVSLGAGGAAQGAGRAALRTAIRGGLDRAAAEALSGQVAAAVARHGGTERAAPLVARLFRRAGLAGHETAAFGEGMEFLGRGQLRVGVPFAEDKLGVDALAKLSGREYAGGKALQQAVAPVRGAVNLERLSREAPPLRPLFDQTRQIMHNAGRAAKAGASIDRDRLVQEFSTIAEKAPTDKARREAIVRQHIDPGYDVRRVERSADGGWKRFDVTPEERELLEQSDISMEELKRWNASQSAKGTLPVIGGTPVANANSNFLNVGDKTYEIASRGGYIPEHALTDLERGWVNDLRGFFERRHDDLVAGGILSPTQKAKNLLTGDYFPRIYSSKLGHLDELAETMKLPPSGYGAAASRGATKVGGKSIGIKGGLALGDADVAAHAGAKFDPHEAVPAYIGQTSREIAKNRLAKWTFDTFGTPEVAGQGSRLAQGWVTHEGRAIPADLANIVHSTFDQSYATLPTALRKWGLDSTPAGRAALTGLEWYGQRISQMKRMVLGKVPGFHAVNAIDDSMKMAADGMINIPGWLNSGSRALSGRGSARVGGKLYSGEELRQFIHQHNIGLGSMERLDPNAHLGEGLTDRLTRVAETAQGQRRGVLAKTADAARYVDTRGDALAKVWEDNSKAAMFLYRLSKGDSPAMAAQRTFSVLLDYEAKGKATQIARWFMPFATWMMKAPASTAAAVVRRPGGVLLPYRTAEALSPDQGYTPRQDITERGAYYNLTDRGEQVAGNIREALGGGAWRPGFGGVAPLRSAFGESLQPWAELLQGNVDPMVMQLGPAGKFAYEYAAQQDLMTKQHMDRPDLTSLVPAGTPFAPAWAQAAAPKPGEAGQMPWASRALAPLAFSPIPLHAANQALFELGGGQARGAPVTTFGSARFYADPGRARDLYAMQRWNLLTRQGLYETDPTGLPQALARRPEVTRALNSAAAAKKRAKESRRNDR